MNRILMASAAFALAASAAHAAPLGGLSVSSGAGSAQSRTETSSPMLAWIEQVVLARFKGEATAPVAKSKRPQPTEGQPECEEAKKAEQEKQAEVKPGLQAGPEPIYLAF